MSDACLYSLVLALEAARPEVLPRHLGRASHVLFLRLIDQTDAPLAAALHDGEGPRPFTCSNLVGGRAEGATLHLAPDLPLWLRFTGLIESVSAHLRRLAEAPPEEVELDGVTLRVRGATGDGGQHPWAGADGYRQILARARAVPERPDRRITLEFASPTTFRSQGVNLPVPLPGHVFGSLLDRWQALAPVALSEDVRRYAAEMVGLAHYRLQTRMLPTKAGGRQVGCVGEATYAALNADRYWLSALRALAEYAFYAGVGAMTTQGLGQARLVESHGRHLGD